MLILKGVQCVAVTCKCACAQSTGVCASTSETQRRRGRGQRKHPGQHRCSAATRGRRGRWLGCAPSQRLRTLVSGVAVSDMFRPFQNDDFYYQQEGTIKSALKEPSLPHFADRVYVYVPFSSYRFGRRIPILRPSQPNLREVKDGGTIRRKASLAFSAASGRRCEIIGRPGGPEASLRPSRRDTHEWLKWQRVPSIEAPTCTIKI